jgi:hypothetical protein
MEAGQHREADNCCKLLMSPTADGIEVREALTQQLLCTIAVAEDGVLHVEGNAIASSVAYDCGEVRSIDLFLHPQMPPPSKMHMLHSVITLPDGEAWWTE